MTLNSPKLWVIIGHERGMTVGTDNIMVLPNTVTTTPELRAPQLGLASSESALSMLLPNPMGTESASQHVSHNAQVACTATGLVALSLHYQC